MADIQSLYKVDTDYYADTVEWCPFASHSNILASGTYQLDEQNSSNDEQSRHGNIVLYKLIVTSAEDDISLEKICCVNCSGVLDMKWCPESLLQTPILGSVSSDGKLCIYKYTDENLVLESSVTPACDLKNMLLSMDWSIQNENSSSLISSDTTGHLNYVSMDKSGLVLLHRWKAHEFESWTAACDKFQPNVVYSGGDDCLFKCWDIRDLKFPVSVSKRHNMGVTAISKNRSNEYVLVTGSYDESVLLWDTRSMKSPVFDISLGGGIWRLKWHPNDASYLLSASMHNGFHVLSVKDGILKLVSHFDKHESLAYGADWKNMNHKDIRLNSGTSWSIAASCSFYDKQLHIWKVKL